VNREIHARLIRRAQEIDPASDTFIAVFEIDNQDHALPAGFRVHLISDQPLQLAAE